MLKIFAPAKINLHLHVTGKRPDNYHLLDSLVCFSDYGDTLFFETAKEFEFSIEGIFAPNMNMDDVSSSRSSTNTIVKAAWLFADALKRHLDVKITLQKNLPLGAGIGGGSADAAACLKGLCRFWNLDIPESFLNDLALKVGSDVPVCLKSQPIIMRGIGDVILVSPEIPPLPAILIWPNQHVPTPLIFKRLVLDEFSKNAEFKSEYTTPLLLANDLKLATRNDLENTAIELFPVIGEALDSLQEEKSCHLARMSGSGSTVFGIFESENDSRAAAEKIQSAHPEWWVRSCWLNRSE